MLGCQEALEVPVGEGMLGRLHKPEVRAVGEGERRVTANAPRPCPEDRECS